MPAGVDALTVWNLALGRIRSKLATATDGSDASEQGKACYREWEPVREATLASHPWSFATQRIKLTEYGDSGPGQHPEPLGVWDGRYQVPAASGTGYDRILSVFEVRLLDDPTVHVDWQWTTDEDENGDQRQWLYADTTDQIQIHAIVDVELDQLPHYFVSLLAWELAAVVAMPLTGNADVAQLAAAQAAIARAAAERQDRRRSSRKGPPPLRVHPRISPRLARWGMALRPVEGETS